MEFKILKRKRNSDEPCPALVMMHEDGIVLLRLVNPKYVTIYEQRDSQPGQVPPIDKQKLPSSPFIYIVLDFREGHNLIAIEIDSSVWSSTDVVAELLQKNINSHLEALRRNFAIELAPETLHINLVERSRKLIKEDGRKVTKLTIYFTRGIIDSKVEEIIKGDAYMKSVEKRMFESDSVELTYKNPNGNRLLDGRGNMLEHFVMLIASEPGDAFRLKISYDNGTTYTCGKDIRMEFTMNADTFMGMLGYGNLFPEMEIGAWLDEKNKEINEQRNNQTTK